MALPSVYVFTPTFGDAIRDETVRSVAAAIAEYGGTAHHVISRHNPHGDGDRRNVGAQLVNGREMFLASGFDKLLTVEHDMLIPPHAIATMIATSAPVVYAPYTLRHGSFAVSAFRYEGDRAVGMSLSMYPAELRAAWAAGEWRVSGVGFGCTMIDREAVSTVPFRTGGAAQDRYPDLPFARDCLAAGIWQVAQFGAACQHYDADTKTWLPPRWQADGGGYMQAEALQTVTIAVNGGSQRLDRGLVYDLPDLVALEAQRAGYVAIIPLEPEELEATKPKRATKPKATAGKK